MTESAKFTPSGIIRSESIFEIFNSPEFKKARRKALKHDPLKHLHHIAKAPPSPTSGPKAAQGVRKRAEFFADRTKPVNSASHPTPLAKAKRPATSHASKPKKSPQPKTMADVYAAYFSSPTFQKTRNKALAYDPFKGAKHIAKAPPAPPKKQVTPVKIAKAGGKKPKIMEQPGLVAAYVYTPGFGPQFEPAKVVRDQTQVSEMLRAGQVGLMSAIAFVDTTGRMHSGTVLEMFPALPSKAG